MKKHLEKTNHRNKSSLFARIARAGALTLTVAGILGVGACRNDNATDGKTPKDSTLSDTSPYTPVQKLFCLNILSNVSSHYNGHGGDTILDSTIYAVDAVLNNSGVQQLIGNWKCVWGPGVLTNTKSVNRSTIAANTLYIVQSLDTPGVYVAAIAGTDFESISDWLGEDADVTYIRYWDSVLANLDTNTSIANIQFGKPFISRATNNGLFQVMNLIDSTQPVNKQRASDFLQQLITNATSPITIWTTGHSLGGALAPTLALYMEDKWSNANKNVAIGCLAVAGATPGNKLFANRFNSELGNNFIRVWNQQDVVPHGYASAWLQTPPPPYLRQVDTLYNSIGINTPDTQLINKLAFTLRSYGYTQLQNTNTGFVSAFYQPADTVKGCKLKPGTFIGQLACQHIPAYAAYFNIGGFQSAVSQALNMQSPFFSEGFQPAQIINTGNYPVLNSLVLNKKQDIVAAK